MNWRALIFLAAVALLLAPRAAAAQTESNQDSFVLRVNGTTRIAANETADSVVGVNGDVVIDGTVKSALWVISGTATVNGRVDGDVMVVDGTLNLKQGGTVKNVTLVRSDLNRDPGATISGSLSRRSEFVSFGWGWTIFSVLFWIGATIVVLLAGLAFAAIAGRQLTNARGLLGARPGESILTAFVLWIGLPILAVLAFFTVVGIPLGIVAFVIVLPALWFLGYLIAGAGLGAALARPLGLTDAPERPYRAVVVGLLVLQLVGLVPFLGGALVLLAGFVGSGALIYLAYRNRGSRRAVGASVRQEPAPAA